MVAESVLITVRNIFNLIPKPWVLFRNLSVVVLKDPVETKSLELQATEIIKRDGPVFPGTHHGDFNVRNKFLDFSKFYKYLCNTMYTVAALMLDVVTAALLYLRVEPWHDPT